MNEANQTPTVKPATKTPNRKPPLRLTRREKDALMADLGLIKVRGSVSGRIYYE